jgi:hypothetical protein
VRIQLPWTPVKTLTKEEQEEEAARKAAKLAELRLKMKEMAAQRKAQKLAEKEALLVQLQELEERVRGGGLMRERVKGGGDRGGWAG